MNTDSSKILVVENLVKYYGTGERRLGKEIRFYIFVCERKCFGFLSEVWV